MREEGYIDACVDRCCEAGIVKRFHLDQRQAQLIFSLNKKSRDKIYAGRGTLEIVNL